MRTDISDVQGVVTRQSGSGLSVNGQDFREAVFDDRWEDQYAHFEEGTGNAALTFEGYRDTGFFMHFFRHSQNDNLFMSYQMSHTWDPTTAVRPHMHFIPMSSGSGVAKFTFTYAWIDVGDVLPDSTGWITGTLTASLTPADQYKQKVVSMSGISPTGQRESSIFVLKVERPGASDPGDTYVTAKDHGTATANVGVIFFDMHYQKIRAGTVTLPAGY